MLRGYSRDDGRLADYCDGTVYKSHGLFSASDSEIPPLEIMAYYDDVEMCNPIGSRAKKHKLGKLHYQDFLGLVNFLNYVSRNMYKMMATNL